MFTVFVHHCGHTCKGQTTRNHITLAISLHKHLFTLCHYSVYPITPKINIGIVVSLINKKGGFLSSCVISNAETIFGFTVKTKAVFRIIQILDRLKRMLMPCYGRVVVSVVAFVHPVRY